MLRIIPSSESLSSPHHSCMLRRQGQSLLPSVTSPITGSLSVCLFPSSVWMNCTVLGQIDFTSYERLDGKLIMPEAVKVLRCLNNEKGESINAQYTLVLLFYYFFAPCLNAEFAVRLRNRIFLRSILYSPPMNPSLRMKHRKACFSLSVSTASATTRFCVLIISHNCNDWSSWISAKGVPDKYSLALSQAC